MGKDEISRAIEQLIELWPKQIDEAEEQIRRRLHGKISEKLPCASLRTVAAGGWRLASPVMRKDQTAKCLVKDNAYPGTRILAEFHKISDLWILVAFDAECPLCFGTGINGDLICELCFGAGWGTYI